VRAACGGVDALFPRGRVTSQLSAWHVALSCVCRDLLTCPCLFCAQNSRLSAAAAICVTCSALPLLCSHAARDAAAGRAGPRVSAGPRVHGPHMVRCCPGRVAFAATGWGARRLRCSRWPPPAPAAPAARCESPAPASRAASRRGCAADCRGTLGALRAGLHVAFAPRRVAPAWRADSIRVLASAGRTARLWRARLRRKKLSFARPSTAA
jgi:hypothetical protein